ncbi:hypothetical protein ABH899_003894 [Paenibacillus sp. RC84]
MKPRSIKDRTAPGTHCLASHDSGQSHAKNRPATVEARAVISAGRFGLLFFVRVYLIVKAEASFCISSAMELSDSADEEMSFIE